MGYTFTIGNGYISKDDESVFVDADIIREVDGPSVESRIPRGNSLSVGYGEWDDFCAKTGTRKLFYGNGYVNGRLEWATDFYRERPYLYQHPGAVLVTRADLDFIRQSMSASTRLGAEYAYLCWLEFWMDYVLENCEVPVFINS